MIIFFNKIRSCYRKKILAEILVLCILLSGVNICSAQELSDGELLSKSCAVIDGYNSRVLFGKNENVPMANASTTKILTCILTLENADLNEDVVISKNAAEQPQVRLGLLVGQTYKLTDLLHGLMLESFNDCAVAIAEHVAGDVEGFSDMLNRKAKEIGCEDTFFITPNGLDRKVNGKEHHTTAVDLCKIMKYCVWESVCAKEFLSITQKRSYECKDPKGQMHLFVNHNHLLESDPAAISGKTGYTAKAGYCYVTAYEKNGLRFCIALLGCGWPNHKDYKWMDAKKLIAYIKKEYVLTSLAEKQVEKSNACRITNGYVGEIRLNKWQNHIYLNGKSQKSEKKDVCLMKQTEKLEVKQLYQEELAAPVDKKEVLGKEQFCVDGTVIGEREIMSGCVVKAWDVKRLFYAVFLQYF